MKKAQKKIPKGQKKKQNNKNNKQKTGNTSQKNFKKKFPYFLCCYRKNITTPIEEFEEFIRGILNEEEIDPNNYIFIRRAPHHVFVNFNNTKDMEKLYLNHKYIEYDGMPGCINSELSRLNTNNSLVFDGLPGDMTRKELDDILTEQYKFIVHTVLSIRPSEKDGNLSAIVDFEFDEDALICFNTVKEIRGYPVQIQFRDQQDNSSSSSSHVKTIVI